MSEFHLVDHGPPQVLRDLYLDSLPEPQEYFFEAQVLAGTTWVAEGVAYGVANADALVELYVVESQRHRLVSLFDQVMDLSGASKVLCKAFDRHLLHASLSRPAQVSPFAFLFRKIVDATFQPLPGLSFREGTAEDFRAILAIDDGFFHDVEEIAEYASHNGLFVLELDGTELHNTESNSAVVGCGVAKPVISGRPAVDIGMLVSPAHRRKGYGTHIVSFLKNYYLQQGKRPICGCGADNIASRRTLSKAGFNGMKISAKG
jgi:RimJ/RimL family protein N-acetyltransferase